MALPMASPMASVMSNTWSSEKGIRLSSASTLPRVSCRSVALTRRAVRHVGMTVGSSSGTSGRAFVPDIGAKSTTRAILKVRSTRSLTFMSESRPPACLMLRISLNSSAMPAESTY